MILDLWCSQGHKFSDVTYPTYDDSVIGAIAPCPVNECIGRVIWKKKNLDILVTAN